MPVFAVRPAHWCRWCGGEITLGRVKQRSWHDGREGEPDCLLEYYLHSRRDHQFRHVEARDGRRCWDCGESPERWLRKGEVSMGVQGWPRGEPLPRYSEVERVTALQVDHEVPLWAVAHLPDDERRPFFGPKNLRLRCDPCHKLKTAREAGERARARAA